MLQACHAGQRWVLGKAGRTLYLSQSRLCCGVGLLGGAMACCLLAPDRCRLPEAARPQPATHSRLTLPPPPVTLSSTRRCAGRPRRGEPAPRGGAGPEAGSGPRAGGAGPERGSRPRPGEPAPEGGSRPRGGELAPGRGSCPRRAERVPGRGGAGEAGPGRGRWPRSLLEATCRGR